MPINRLPLVLLAAFAVCGFHATGLSEPGRPSEPAPATADEATSRAIDALTRGGAADREKRRKYMESEWEKEYNNKDPKYGEFEGSKKIYSLDRIKAEDAAITETESQYLLNFDADAAGSVPAGFRVATTSGQAPGDWRVESSYEATSGAQLVSQRNANRDDRFTALLFESTPKADRVDVAARVQIKGDGQSQTAGVIVCSPGTADGYALLLDVANDRVNVQRVVNGTGEPLLNEDPVRGVLGDLRSFDDGVWYQFRLEAHTQGTGRTRLVGYLNEVKFFEGDDNVYLEPGLVGLVTSQDTRASFDTMTVSKSSRWTGEVVTPVQTSTPGPQYSGESGGVCQKTYAFDFNELPHGRGVPGFSSEAAGEGFEGEWQAMADDVDNPRNVVQISEIRDAERFPALLLEERNFADFNFRFRVRTKSGHETNRLAGAIFRQKDAANYYFAAIHTGQDKVILARVANKKIQVIEENQLNLKNNNWYEIKITADGTRIKVAVDGDTKIDAKDNTYATGRLGFITRSNTVAQFDDFNACTFRND